MDIFHNCFVLFLCQTVKIKHRMGIADSKMAKKRFLMKSFITRRPPAASIAVSRNESRLNEKSFWRQFQFRFRAHAFTSYKFESLHRRLQGRLKVSIFSIFFKSWKILPLNCAIFDICIVMPSYLLSITVMIDCSGKTSRRVVIVGRLVE